MNRLKLACLILYLLSGALFVIGFIYSFTPKILPYHVNFLGKTHEQLDPKIRDLLIQSLRAGGAFLFSIGTVLILLTKKLSLENNNWIRWTFLLMIWIFCWPILRVTFTVGFDAPWYLFLAMIILSLVAFILSKQEKH